jgi:hypothetical protein
MCALRLAQDDRIHELIEGKDLCTLIFGIMARAVLTTLTIFTTLAGFIFVDFFSHDAAP